MMLDVEGWRCNGEEEDINVWRKKERKKRLGFF